jgi:hypothetical protein
LDLFVFYWFPIRLAGHDLSQRVKSIPSIDM